MNHPLDPGWERGKYRRCHKHFRRQAKTGDIVFDVVKVNNEYRIRSVFIVRKTSGGIYGQTLHFRGYWFCDGSEAYDVTPLRGPKGNFSRRAKKVNQEEAERILDYVTKRYRRFGRGHRPRSVPKKAWEKMCERAATTTSC